jgi:hypothetical protein
MSSYQEKLSILSELINFARIDHRLNEKELDFLRAISRRLDVDESVFESLVRSPLPTLKLESLSDRLVQFHRLFMLMNIDEDQDPSEVEALYNYGLSMGLPVSAIRQLLEVMHEYPDRIVPADVIVKIFHAHYN